MYNTIPSYLIRFYYRKLQFRVQHTYTHNVNSCQSLLFSVSFCSFCTLTSAANGHTASLLSYYTKFLPEEDEFFPNLGQRQLWLSGQADRGILTCPKQKKFDVCRSCRLFTRKKKPVRLFKNNSGTQQCILLY